MIYPIILCFGSGAVAGLSVALASRARINFLNAKAAIPLRRQLVDIGTRLAEDESLSESARRIGVYFIAEACSVRRERHDLSDRNASSVDEIRIRRINEFGERVGHEVFKGISTLALIWCFERTSLGRALRKLGIADAPTFLETLPNSIYAQHTHVGTTDQAERLACGVPKVEDATKQVDRYLSMA